MQDFCSPSYPERTEESVSLVHTLVWLASIRTHFCFQYLYFERKDSQFNFCGLYVCVKIALFSSYFSLLDPRRSEYYTFSSYSYYTIHINNSNGLLGFLMTSKDHFPVDAVGFHDLFIFSGEE